MTGMLFLSSCSIKEDRNGCPCWMTVEMANQFGHDGSVILQLRGNSNEDAVDYEYQVTETIRTDASALEYEVPRGSVGVSAVAFGNDIPCQAGYDKNEIRIPIG
jgi:hypothetical protein